MHRMHVKLQVMDLRACQSNETNNRSPYTHTIMLHARLLTCANVSLVRFFERPAVLFFPCVFFVECLHLSLRDITS